MVKYTEFALPIVPEVKVITAESEPTFEEKFKVAIEEVEAVGKIVNIKFTTDAIPIKPGGAATARLYYTAFIAYERSQPVQMDSIK